MNDLIARVLTRKYPSIVPSTAVLDIPFGWITAAERAVVALRDLHPGIRVTAVGKVTGLLWIDVDYAHPDTLIDIVIDMIHHPEDLGHVIDVVKYPDDIIDRVLTVVNDARTLSAWTCVADGHAGWRVETSTGPTVLCPECQREKGMEPRRYEA